MPPRINRHCLRTEAQAILSVRGVFLVDSGQAAYVDVICRSARGAHENAVVNIAADFLSRRDKAPTPPSDTTLFLVDNA